MTRFECLNTPGLVTLEMKNNKNNMIFFITRSQSYHVCPFLTFPAELESIFSRHIQWYTLISQHYFLMRPCELLPLDETWFSTCIRKFVSSYIQIKIIIISSRSENRSRKEHPYVIIAKTARSWLRRGIFSRASCQKLIRSDRRKSFNE